MDLYMALEHDLEIIPVINKIDLPSADIEMVKHQINHDLGLDPDHAVLVSAKTGAGVAKSPRKAASAIIRIMFSPQMLKMS